MKQGHSLTLTNAILININIMLGSGIFINTVELSKRAGALSSLTYVIIGLLMLPLVTGIAELTKLFPSGGFYTFGRYSISPFTGFLAAWSYFIGKLASGTLILHTSLLLMQSIIPALAAINIYYLDMLALVIFVALNTRNVKTGGTIQTFFTITKLIPVIFTLAVGAWLLSSSNFAAEYIMPAGLTSCLPLVLYATMGFEAACLISSKIENAEVNAPRAIYISYGITVCILALYQTLFWASVGPQLMTSGNTYLDAFPTLLQTFMPTSPLIPALKTLLHLAIASSAMGGSYGIMFSNTWNLYTLSSNGHTFFSGLLTRLNRHAIPIGCVIVEGLVYLAYLLVSRGQQLPLQQLSGLGVLVAYTLSMLALIALRLTTLHSSISLWIPALGLINCALIALKCIDSLLSSGPATFYLYLGLLGFGVMMFFLKKK